MIALIPATAVVTENDRLKVGGTIWDGVAVVGSTIRFAWDFAPLDTIGNLAFTADWNLTGTGTDLTGELAQAGDQLQVEDVTGLADGALLDVLFPNLPLRCRFDAEISIDYLHLGGDGQGGAGGARTGPAACHAKDLAAFPVDFPAMRGELVPGDTMTSGALAAAAGRERLIELRLSPDGMLSIWPTQAATRIAPVLAGQRYDTKVE